jgi:hypothetical protein
VKLVVLAGIGLLSACNSTPVVQKDGTALVQQNYQLSNIAKSSLDVTAEFHQQASQLSLRTLAEKLYKRNPRELKKSGLSLSARLTQLLSDPLPTTQAQSTLLLAFQPDYTDDRVYAYMRGLTAMINAAYNNQTEFYVIDQLDPQKLYNSARNIEVAAWKLNTSKDANNTPYLLANELDNYSFEREFGKLIANQDILARIVADRTNRSINWFAQTAGRMVFLPF